LYYWWNQLSPKVVQPRRKKFTKLLQHVARDGASSSEKLLRMLQDVTMYG